MYQIHILKGSRWPILVTFSKYEKELVALDFGCMKQILDFYNPYFELDKNVINDPKLFNAKLFELEILRTDDSKENQLLHWPIWFTFTFSGRALWFFWWDLLRT
jgi:hypothetical protein